PAGPKPSAAPPRQEGRRAPEIPGSGERLEAIEIELHGFRREAHLTTIGIDAAVAGETTQHPDRLVQGVARRGFGLLGPEEADQVLARPRALGRPCEVD